MVQDAEKATPHGPAAPARGPGRKWRRVLLRGLAVLFVAACTFGAIQAAKAASFGRDGKAALLRAEAQLSARNLDPARQELAGAHRSFDRMGEELDRLGPLLSVARLIPLIRPNVLAVEAMQEAGVSISLAGEQLADAAQSVLQSPDEGTRLGGVVDRLRTIHGSLTEGVGTLKAVQARIDTFNGRRLIGPVDDAQRELSGRLGRVVGQASSAESGAAAAIEFAGGNGPRRYLFLSQNPDEIRPTGGFIGMYGVVAADQGKLDIVQPFQNIAEFNTRHPNVAVAGSQAGSPFRFAQSPLPQRLSNVNSTPDWPRGARLAVDFWERAGEEPVNGVISFTPAFLARMLSVIGPVEVASYGETVTSENLIERFDYYTEQEEVGEEREKKRFIADLGNEVFARVVDLPPSAWQRLAEALGEALSAREGMVWSTDEKVSAALHERGWDGAFPETPGDFFYNAEFSYAAKNGRGLKRTFDHHVALRPDGSARITTTIRMANTEGTGLYNPSFLSYVTLYGPAGASLNPDSDPPVSMEPPVSGHPAAGFFASVPAGLDSTLRVVWDAPAVARKGSDGTWRYSLWWMRVPDHSGDVLNLRVALPGGWRWKEAAPPARAELTKDLRGEWALVGD